MGTRLAVRVSERRAMLTRVFATLVVAVALYVLAINAVALASG